MGLAKVSPLIYYNQTLNQLRALNHIIYNTQGPLITKVIKDKPVKEEQSSRKSSILLKKPSFFYFTPLWEVKRLTPLSTP